MISTPILAMGEPMGPMLYAMTYMVRPFIAPLKSPVSMRLVSAGSRQLFVGPASLELWLQMKVNSSTRATSAGSDRTSTLFGRRAGSSHSAVPPCTMARSMAWYSSAEPSHQITRSGSHIVSATLDIGVGLISAQTNENIGQ